MDAMTARRPFAALTEFLTLMVEAGPRTEAIRVLTRTSDETLAARGTTREREIRRLVGVA
jgi:hypothetical protein